MLKQIKKALINAADSKLYDIANDYFKAKGHGLIYRNDEDTIIKYFNNNLLNYLNSISSEYYRNDRYFRVIGKKLYSFNYVSSIMGTANFEMYVFENLDKYREVLEIK